MLDQLVHVGKVDKLLNGQLPLCSKTKEIGSKSKTKAVGFKGRKKLRTKRRKTLGNYDDLKLCLGNTYTQPFLCVMG